jgi:hypothetical protein
MRQNSLRLLIAVCVVATSGGSFAQEQPPGPRIILDQPAHFVAPDGAALALAPGMYEVEAAGESVLRLSEQGNASALLLKATSIPHKESLGEITVALIPAGEDTVHLVLLHPDGTALDAVGSLTGVQSRAPAPVGPGLSTTPLTPSQIGQGLIVAGETARMVGVPPAPLLTTPTVGHSVAAWGEQFSWQPGTGTPAPTSYQLCIAEAGKPCARVGQPSTTSVVIANLPPSMRTYRVTGPMLQPLLTYGQQKNLTWTVGACAPSQVIGTAVGTISGGAAQLTCQYARPLPLTWKLALSAPVPNSPEPLINDRPRLSIQNPVEGVHHYLFCLVNSRDQTAAPITICDNGSREYAVHQAGASVGDGGMAIVNTGTSLSTSGWEWKHEAQTLPGSNTNRVSVIGIPYFGTTSLDWTVGACLDELHPCSWSPPIRLSMLPTIEGGASIRSLQESASRYRFEWVAAASSSVTHYRLCIATKGSALSLIETPNRAYELVYFPGMLRDLCSGDIPPGQQPAYQRQLPPEVASLCPAGGCQMPQPVQTFSVAGQARYILDLHEHPELAPFGGQPIILAIAACSYSNRNCLWWWSAFRKMDLPTASREPSPVRLGGSSSSFSLHWEPWWGNTFYVPCVREANQTCETGNLLSQPRLDAPRVGASRDHPQNCSLSGTPFTDPPRHLSGTKVIQVAGCNDAWGCRWAPPETVDFTSVDLPNRTTPPLLCRHP